MTDSELLQRTRQLLLALAAAMFAGTIVELIFAEHYDGFIQLLPFLCCGAALVTIAFVWRSPEQRTLLIHRGAMVIISAVSIFGVGEHIWNDILRAQEFNSGISGMELVRTALTGGIPALAPAALAAGAMVALVATYGMQSNPQPAAQPSSLRRV